MTYVLYHVPDSSKYTSFEVPKKSGGYREIDAPIPQLKLLQRRVADLLQGCLLELEDAEGVKPACALSHGFHQHRSIATNAQNHKSQRWVLNIDLKDFFPSINFGRVRGYFLKNRHFELTDEVSTTLAQIACHENRLPQGSPCSPVISNLLAHLMDIRLNRLTKRHRCSYSRYADDLTISTATKHFPSSIATKHASSWVLSDKLRHIVFASGYELNHKKTRMQYYWSRQDATGLVVNKKVNVRRDYVKRTRARCHHLFETGLIFEKQEFWGSTIEVPYDVSRLAGELSHIFWVKGKEYKYERQKGAPKSWPNFLRDHKRFLDFLSFAHNQEPTVLLEGKTDNIYLKCALKSLHAKYPGLISPDPGHNLLLRLFRYSQQSDTLQSLAGGTGDLKLFINTYKDRVSNFKAASFQNPVIIIVDNDKGAGEVFSAATAKSDTKTKVDGSKPFYHITKNLYLVPIPLLPKTKETFVEHLFDPSELKRKIGKKTFHLPSKGFDPAKHFGKAPFAEQIVAKRRDKIDFSGFEPLLNGLQGAITDYAAKVKAGGAKP